MKDTILRGIDVEMVLSPERCLISTDEEKLRRIIEGLARNAVAAMRAAAG